MKKKIEESMLILAYAFLLCLCAALLCSNASAENAVDLANTPGHDGWLDADGNELGTTELPIRDEDLPPYVDKNNMTVSVEKLIPMSDGLWQLVCFWENVDPESEDPALIQQDNLLLPVPEL